MIHKARIWLIRLGKILPFVVCFIVLLSYTESILSLITNKVVEYDDYYILYKPITFAISSYFEYNIQTLVVLSLISISIRTCFYNKLTCVYLGINLFEKSYFDFELEPTAIYVICVCNIVVACYLIYKGIKIIIK